jgi:hypothetical protein
LKNATIPVLVVNRRGHEIERMVIYLADGEKDLIDVLDGGRLAKRLGLPVTLLHVASATGKLSPETESHLNRELTTLKKLGVSCDLRLRQASTPVQGMIAEFHGGGHEILVMGQHRSGSRKSVAVDSLILQVLSRVDRPVLVIPYKESLDQQERI